jgi:hypothetical protein
MRASLANLDAAAVLLIPDHSSQIVRRRTRYFGRNELSRLALGALRKAGTPLALVEIAAYAIKERNLPAGSQQTVMDMLYTVLRNAVTRGTLIKTGKGRDTRWSIAP